MMYFITFNSQCVGPMSVSQLLAYPVNENTPVSTDGINWQPLYAYPELMQAYQASKMGVPGSNNGDSKRIVAGICAIILGTLGIQYFVIGKPVAGVLTILLSLCTCGLWQIVTIVQGIMMLTMTDEQFRQKYVDTTATLPLF